MTSCLILCILSKVPPLTKLYLFYFCKNKMSEKVRFDYLLFNPLFSLEFHHWTLLYLSDWLKNKKVLLKL